jgi:hypothetical protein
MFDAYLCERAGCTGGTFTPFGPDRDYGQYVEGRPRADGVRTFLKSRNIELPEGKPDDGPDAEPSMASVTARTRCCCVRSNATASPPTKVHAAICKQYPTPPAAHRGVVEC